MKLTDFAARRPRPKLFNSKTKRRACLKLFAKSRPVSTALRTLSIRMVTAPTIAPSRFRVPTISPSASQLVTTITEPRPPRLSAPIAPCRARRARLPEVTSGHRATHQLLLATTPRTPWTYSLPARRFNTPSRLQTSAKVSLSLRGCSGSTPMSFDFDLSCSYPIFRFFRSCCHRYATHLALHLDDLTFVLGRCLVLTSIPSFRSSISSIHPCDLCRLSADLRIVQDFTPVHRDFIVF